MAGAAARRTLGEILRTERERNDLTLTDVGKEIGVTPTAIGNYEKNRRVPDERTLERLAILFRTSRAQMLTAIEETMTTRPSRAGMPFDKPSPIYEIDTGFSAEPRDPFTPFREWAIPESVCRLNLRAHPENLKIKEVVTDWLEPTIRRGDFVLIDTSRRSIDLNDGVWLLSDLNEIVGDLRNVTRHSTTEDGQPLYRVWGAHGSNIWSRNDFKVLGLVIMHFRKAT